MSRQNKQRAKAIVAAKFRVERQSRRAEERRTGKRTNKPRNTEKFNSRMMFAAVAALLGGHD